MIVNNKERHFVCCRECERVCERTTTIERETLKEGERGRQTLTQREIKKER